jgi:hypothetical protein
MEGIILQNKAVQRDFYYTCTQGTVYKNYTRDTKHTRHEDMDYKTKMSDTSQPQINLKRSQSS